MVDFERQQLVTVCRNCNEFTSLLLLNQPSDILFWFTLPPDEECQVMELGLSVRARNSKTIAQIHLMFSHKKYKARGSVLL